jgi:hypothetical protein
MDSFLVDVKPRRSLTDRPTRKNTLAWKRNSLKAQGPPDAAPKSRGTHPCSRVLAAITCACSLNLKSARAAECGAKMLRNPPVQSRFGGHDLRALLKRKGLFLRGHLLFHVPPGTDLQPAAHPAELLRRRGSRLSRAHNAFDGALGAVRGQTTLRALENLGRDHRFWLNVRFAFHLPAFHYVKYQHAGTTVSHREGRNRYCHVLPRTACAAVNDSAIIMARCRLHRCQRLSTIWAAGGFRSIRPSGTWVPTSGCSGVPHGRSASS